MQHHDPQEFHHAWTYVTNIDKNPTTDTHTTQNNIHITTTPQTTTLETSNGTTYLTATIQTIQPGTTWTATIPTEPRTNHIAKQANQPRTTLFGQAEITIHPTTKPNHTHPTQITITIADDDTQPATTRTLDVDWPPPPTLNDLPRYPTHHLDAAPHHLQQAGKYARYSQQTNINYQLTEAGGPTITWNTTHTNHPDLQLQGAILLKA